MRRADRSARISPDLGCCAPIDRSDTLGASSGPTPKLYDHRRTLFKDDTDSQKAVSMISLMGLSTPFVDMGGGQKRPTRTTRTQKADEGQTIPSHHAHASTAARGSLMAVLLANVGAIFERSSRRIATTTGGEPECRRYLPV